MTSLAAHNRWLLEHDRRLDGLDADVSDVAEHVTSLRINFAKLLAIASVLVVLVSSAATTVIVRFLTPQPSSAPAATTKAASR